MREGYDGETNKRGQKRAGAPEAHWDQTGMSYDSYPLHAAVTFQSELCRERFYLDSRQHDGDQVVVWEQQGADDAAVTDVLDDSCGGGRRM